MTVIVAQTFVGLFTVVNFLVHQKEIAETLCVQKEDQQGCNGKCHLVSELKSSITEDTKVPLKNKNKLKINFDYFIDNLKIPHTLEYTKNRLVFSPISTPNTTTQYYDVSTPPPNFI